MRLKDIYSCSIFNYKNIIYFQNIYIEILNTAFLFFAEIFKVNNKLKILKHFISTK